MGETCGRCGGDSIKNGVIRGKQRHKCKSCGYQFVEKSPRGKPLPI